MSNWIPISNAPNPEQWVLAYFEDGTQGVGLIMVHEKVEPFVDEDGDWNWGWEGVTDFMVSPEVEERVISGVRITHWMPLPKPPKAGDT